MARPRNIIPQFITMDALKLDIIQNEMPSDAELGKWFRKAIRDIRTGCHGNNVDSFILSQYKLSEKRMTARQEINAKSYEDRKTAKQKKKSSKKQSEETTAVNTKQPELLLLPTETKQAYGEFKHVLLTQSEGEKLRDLYGENLSLAIAKLDSWIENNPLKSAKRKNHYAMMNRSGWVYTEVQKVIAAEGNAKKATTTAKSFDAENRERGSNMALSVMAKTRMI